MNTPDATQNTPSEPKLLDQLRDWIRLKHYSIRSEAQYVTHGWCRLESSIYASSLSFLSPILA